MCKKLMFLISLVCLLGLSAGARAEELEVGCGETVIIDSAVEIDDFQIECDGKIIVTSTGTFTVNDESTIRGDDARLIIDGGVMYMNGRINVGKSGYAAYIDIIGGGLLEHHGEKITIPDDSGGDHVLSVLDGVYTAEETEIIYDRTAWAVVGCAPGTKLETCNTDSYNSRDPEYWLENGALECGDGCVGPFIQDIGDDCKRVICVKEPNEAYLPYPEDGAKQVPVDVCLTWRMGSQMGGHPGDKHYVFFGEDCCDIIVAEIGDPEYKGFKPVGLEEYCPPGLELWTTYCWRVDEKPFGQPTFKGDVWSFTTGCEMVPGDINLDCFVDGQDYAMLADDWMVESFFPEDF